MKTKQDDDDDFIVTDVWYPKLASQQSEPPDVESLPTSHGNPISSETSTSDDHVTDSQSPISSPMQPKPQQESEPKGRAASPPEWLPLDPKLFDKNANFFNDWIFIPHSCLPCRSNRFRQPLEQLVRDYMVFNIACLPEFGWILKLDTRAFGAAEKKAFSKEQRHGKVYTSRVDKSRSEQRMDHLFAKLDGTTLKSGQCASYKLVMYKHYRTATSVVRFNLETLNELVKHGRLGKHHWRSDDDVDIDVIPKGPRRVDIPSGLVLPPLDDPLLGRTYILIPHAAFPLDRDEPHRMRREGLEFHIDRSKKESDTHALHCHFDHVYRRLCTLIVMKDFPRGWVIHYDGGVRADRRELLSLLWQQYNGSVITFEDRKYELELQWHEAGSGYLSSTLPE